MSRRHCPHVGNDRFGDEQEWCVVCLRDEVKDLKARLKQIRLIGDCGQFRFHPMHRDTYFRTLDLRVKNWRKP